MGDLDSFLDLPMDPFGQESAGQPRGEEERSRQKSYLELEREVDRLRLVVETLVRALIEKNLYTREQLNAMANLIDMEDGFRDGRRRVHKEIRKCSSCGRNLMNVSGACLYCGHQEVMEII